MHSMPFSEGTSDPDEPYQHVRADEPVERGFSRARDRSTALPDSVPYCPKCDSPRVVPRNFARKTGGAIGAVAGAAGGIAVALSNSNYSPTSVLVATPVGAACGAIAGAVIAGLVGGAAGCTAGSAFGEIVDEKVLDNFRCYTCGYTFSRVGASG